MADAPEVTAKYVRMFEEAEEASVTARANAERDRDYYDGKQLTAEEVAALKKRGQPPLIINRIRRKIDWLRGLEIQRRTDPKAFPRNPTAEQDADAATDAIRYVVDKADFDRKRSAITENMLVEGVGGCEVIHKNGPRGVEIVINRYAWDRLFWDPHSSEPDFSDARYKGAVIWMDADELKGEATVKPGDVDWTLEEAGTSDTYDDRPKWNLWADKARKRVRVVLVYYMEGGEWRWCRYFKGGIIDKGTSPYVDQDGESVCPLIMASIYTDRDNNRYGVVRDMVDPQDEINKRRSKALHQLTMRQAVMEQGAVDSMEDTRRELARPDGIIVTNPDMKFEIANQSDLASGQLTLLQESKAEIDLMGANSALAGETGESASGRAVIARQQGGMIEIAGPMDSLHWLTKAVYEHIWMRIRQFWTEERWIRVTDDERNTRFVGLNRPVTLADDLREMPEQDAIGVARQIGLRPDDPRLSVPYRVANNVAELDVDIIMEEAPDQVTLQAEEFQALMGLGPALIQSNGAYAPLVSELLIETAPNLRAETRDRLRKKMDEVQQQGVNPMQAMEMQMGMEKAEADTQAVRARAAKDEASAMQILSGVEVA